MASSAPRAAYVTALLLLSLVAIDLGSPTLCALDRPAPIHTTEAAAGGATEHPEAPRPPAHVDDCFCCSHCVQPGVALEPLGLTLLRDRLSLPVTDSDVSALGAPFHPPRS